MKRYVAAAWLVATACALLLGVRYLTVGLAGATPSAAPSGESSSPIPPTLFGMHVHMRPMRPQPWPDAPIGTFRFADFVGWDKLNPAEGSYDWKWFDKEMEDLKAHHVEDVLFTFHSTPRWASSGPDHRCAHGALAQLPEGNNINTELGMCDPPNDLLADGSGSDQHWIDFLSAIAIHNKESKAAHIKYWEIWNEPHNDFFWSGTHPQMVRMARDAYVTIKSIDPSAVIVSPSVGTNPRPGMEWMQGYLAAGGGQYADVIAFHGYLHSTSATDLVPRVANFRKMLAEYGQDTKPLWDTEASWGNAEHVGLNEEQQTAFVAQFYLLHWSIGIPRLYWFGWNDGNTGTLWIPDRDNPSNPGTLTKAGQAYITTYHWLVGATLTKPCAAEGEIWSCTLKEKDGREAQVTWSANGEKPYSPKPSFKKMRDLEGNTTAVAGAIRVGELPVLLETQ